MPIYLIVSFLASTIGVICGIGGGVIIKPVLDVARVETVSVISFLSGCTVLSMSGYSVVKTMLAGEKQVDTRCGTPLAIGAAVGGLVGNRLFAAVRGLFDDLEAVGAVQAICLALVTVGTLLYTLYKDRISPREVSGVVVSVLIGLALGIMSSFLGIGGGPINLVVLHFFFRMETKSAAANSLYIILFSQAANLLTAVISGSVPAFRWSVLLLMVVGGIGGGIVGRYLNRKMKSETIEKLFVCLMVIIIGISIYNSWHYAAM